MEQSSPTKVNEGVTNGDATAAYSTMTYQPVALASAPPSAGTTFPPASQAPPAFPFNPAPVSEEHQTVFQQAQQLHHQQQQYQQEQLQAFWADQMAEIEQTADFKVHSLPLARIKKIMKADEDVKMIAGEAPVVFAKACEMFILELTLRAWMQTEGAKRRTLQRSDVVAAITRTDMFDFLVDIIPPEELKGDGVVGMPPPTTAPPMAVPSYVPEMSVPFGIYENQQPLSFKWSLPEQQQEQEQQQETSDGGRDERD
jgi:nuclear transcription factor Y, gamma